MDKFSYAIGLGIGQNLLGMGWFVVMEGRMNTLPEDIYRMSS